MPCGARVAMIPCAIKLQSACVAVYERWNFFLRSTRADNPTVLQIHAIDLAATERSRFGRVC